MLAILLSSQASRKQRNVDRHRCEEGLLLREPTPTLSAAVPTTIAGWIPTSCLRPQNGYLLRRRALIESSGQSPYGRVRLFGKVAKRTIVVCMLAVLVTQSLTAQTLSRSQEGQMMVGKCYSDCLQSGDSTGPIAWLAMYWDNWRDSDLWTDREWDDFVALWRNTGCAASQQEVIVLYACGQGCIDVERAYGVTSSFARTAFKHELADGTRALRSSGLWNTNNRNAPTAGTAAFSRACTAFFGAASTSSDSSDHSVLGTYRGAYQGVDNKVKRTPTEKPRSNDNVTR